MVQIASARLRELRHARGLTQGDVAAALGYPSQIGYHYIETGKRRLRGDIAIRLAELLGVGVEGLYEARIDLTP
jgi:putative transcriptional regulator